MLRIKAVTSSVAVNSLASEVLSIDGMRGEDLNFYFTVALAIRLAIGRSCTTVTERR